MLFNQAKGAPVRPSCWIASEEARGELDNVIDPLIWADLAMGGVPRIQIRVHEVHKCAERHRIVVAVDAKENPRAISALLLPKTTTPDTIFQLDAAQGRIGQLSRIG